MQTTVDKIKWSKNINSLTKEERDIIIEKGTERPFSGTLLDNKESGIYTCKLCDSPLFSSNSKFNSYSGWPSFDDALLGAINEIPDRDGRRVEIVCATCGGHLGHLFKNEGFTPKNRRYCVNSLSLNFKGDK